MRYLSVRSLGEEDRGKEGGRRIKMVSFRR